jgi:ribosomal protein S27AE
MTDYDETEVILLKGRLDGKQRNRLKRLLDMMYKPREIADEIGVSVDRVYMVWIPGGCPHERDERANIWINGKAFKQWFEVTYAKRPLKAGEGFCRTCRRGVVMVDRIRQNKDRLTYDLGKCPNCGRGLLRIVNNHRKHND